MNARYLHLLHNRTFHENLKRLFRDEEQHQIIINGDSWSLPEEKKISRQAVMDHIDRCEVLFIHFLDYEKAYLVNRISNKKKIVWFFWGGDGYRLGKFTNDFLLPKTKKTRLLLSTRYFFNGGWKDLIKIITGPLYDYLPPNHEVFKALKKVDVIVPIVPRDYENLASRYNLSARMHHLNYVNDVFASNPVVTHGGYERNLLLGNSARYSNNHIEFIDKIKVQDLGDRRVIIPLGYGDDHYRSYVSTYAKKMLGDRVTILKRFLPLDEYRQIFDSCDTIVMNHCRQQALGNILMAIWFEKTVYMNTRSGLYEYLAERNFNILDIGTYEVGKTLSADQKESNKQLMKKFYNPDLQQRRFSELLTSLDTH